MDISQSNWKETDGLNSAAAPNGAPEGMAPAGVNDTMRAMMGGIKRFWDRINGTVKTTKVGNAYTYTPTVAAPALVDGEIYTFRANGANTGAATLNVGIGGAQNLVKADGISGVTNLVTNDILPGCYYMAAWDSLSTQFVVLNSGLATIPPGSISADVNAAIRSTSATIKLDVDSVSAVIAARLVSDSAVFTAALSSVAAITVTDNRSMSADIKADISSVSAVITAALGAGWAASDRSTSLVIKTDISSVSAAIAVAFNANDDSTSAVIKADIASVSAAITVAYGLAIRSTSDTIKTDISSVSAVLQIAINGAGSVPAGAKMFFYNNAAPSGWTFAAANDYALIAQGVAANGGSTGGAWAISGLSNESADHYHGMNFTTGFNSSDKPNSAADTGANTYANPAHYHSVIGNTGGTSANHTHTGDGNWRPLHLKVIMCTKN